MTPPKKATPSLRNLMNSKDEQDNPTPESSEKENDNVTQTVITPETPETDRPQGHGVVVEQGKPVEENPNITDNGQLNPDGVTFSGRSNPVDKTPADMAAESPEESARRYGINDEIPEHVANDPNVQVYGDNKNYQVAAGTHLHPDVARDNYNRSLDTTNYAVQTSRPATELVFAGEAEVDDKGRAGVVEEEFDRDEDYSDDAAREF